MLLGFTGLYWIVIRFHIGFYGFTGFYRALLGFTGFYWVLLGVMVVLYVFTGFYWVCIGFYCGLLGLYWDPQKVLRFYWVLLGFLGFEWVFNWFNGPLKRNLKRLACFTGFYRVSRESQRFFFMELD